MANYFEEASEYGYNDYMADYCMTRAETKHRRDSKLREKAKRRGGNTQFKSHKNSKMKEIYHY